MKLQNLSERFLLIVVWLVLLLSAGCGGGGGTSDPSGTGGSLPVAPTGVTATAGNGQVAISWTAVTGASGYKVYRGTVTGALSTKTAIATNITATAYTDTTASNGTTYYYQVTAVNSNGESAGSSETNAMPTASTTSQPPSAPLGVSATGGNAQTTISWTAVTGATSYNVYWSLTSGVTKLNGLKVASNITATTFIDTIGLSNGTTYYYIVTAVNAYGESAESVQVSATPTSTPASGSRQWTYMVYMGADNNLSNEGLGDLNEMETVGSSAGVAIVVQAEFSKEYTTGMTTSDAGRIYVQNDGNPNAPNLNAGTSIGNVDMASPATLTAFINWAVSNYPAQHYALVVWDHGNGWKARKLASPIKGAVQDETSGTFMSLPDLAKGVSNSCVHFDVINFDACLMAMYEVAYEFSGLTDYMVFSEQTEPGEGDPYDTILGSLAANPLMTAQSLASTIVDKYDQFYTSNNRGGTTKSAVDMSKLATLDTKIIALVTALNNDGASSTIVQAAQSNTQEYALPSNHDIWAFSDYLVNSAAGAAVKTAAGDVKTAITSMIVNNQTNGTDMANSHGLAIYLPSASEANAQDLTAYALLASNKTSRAAATGTWGSYIEALTGGGTLTYGTGNFALYLYWTKPDGTACNSDLDLYVSEPDGSGVNQWYSPWMGQTTPNGFFSAESSQSGQPEEFYMANKQVVNGTYTFLANFFADGSSCTQATAHVLVQDLLTYGDSNWHEPFTPKTMDLTNKYITGCSTLACIGAYSDWWDAGSSTRMLGAGAYMTGIDLPINTRNSQLIIRYQRGSVLQGIIP